MVETNKLSKKPEWAKAFEQRMMKKGGVQAALSWLKSEFAKGRLKPVSWTEALQFIARSLFNSYPEASLAVFECLQQSVPEDMNCCVYIGTLQDKLGKRDLSKISMRKVVDAEHADPRDVLQAANMLVRFGEQEVALNAAVKAYEAMGRPIDCAATLLYIAQLTADWPLVDQLTNQLREAHQQGLTHKTNESPRTHLLWCDNEALYRKVLKNWSEKNIRTPVNEPPDLPSPEGRKLRIGYLSSDFRDHPTSYLILGVLRHHDKSKVELFMYCSGWDDGSQLRKQVENQFDYRHSVSHLSDEDAADLIRSHQIDVLVELNGPTRANRMGILSYRPAPVQVDYLGWPGSVGGRVVDYVVGDYYTVPEGSEIEYPEKVIRLFPTYQSNDHKSYKLPNKPTRQQVGLPVSDELVILGMFNAINKVHQTVWDTWMQIMQSNDKTVLWLLDPGVAAQKHVKQQFENAGLSADRLIFAPRMRHIPHLTRLQCCDLILDPWPYGGHTSTSDALYAGIPVLAMQGNNFAARVSASLIKASGLDKFVAYNVEEYVNIGKQLLSNTNLLRKLQQQIREQIGNSPIFNAKSRAYQLEQAFRQAAIFASLGVEAKHIQIKMPEQVQLNTKPLKKTKKSNTVDWNNYRVAVVTPYYKIEPEKLERCCASVKAQTYACDHFLVADGAPQELPKGFDITHLVLPKNVGNCGSTPRGFGAQYATALGYDAIAFLDADNWYEPNHIELAVKTLEKDQLDCVFTRRNIIFPDGEVLLKDDPQDTKQGHVDTNCYVISKRAAFLFAYWSMYPKEFGAGEDRFIKKIIDFLKLKTRLIPEKTVWYETNWANHYRMAKKTPISPVRKPEKFIWHHWDEDLFFQRTGLTKIGNLISKKIQEAKEKSS